MDAAAGLITPAGIEESTEPAEAVTRPAPAAAPRIAADPNLVPAGDGLGRTTISWSTGGAVSGQVWVAQAEESETLFAEGSSGTTIAPWIQLGIAYEFRLYADAARRTLLGSVRVVGEEPTSVAAPEAARRAAPRRAAGGAFVSARVQGGTAVVDWATGDVQPGRLYRLDRHGRETLVAEGPSGSTTIGGVGRRRVIPLRLYGARPGRPLLAQTALIGRRPYIQALPNPVPKSEGLGETMIYWATKDGAVGHIFLLTEDGQEIPFSAAPEGAQPVAWIAPNVAYRFRLYADRDRKQKLASVTVTQGSEWREIALDLAFLAALAAPVVLLLLLVWLALRAIF